MTLETIYVMISINRIKPITNPTNQRRTTMVTTNQVEQLRKFLDAFIWTDCSDEIYLKEDQKETYQDFVKELHDDEFPNNWRYTIITDLLQNFVNEYEQDDLENYLHEITDSLVDVYNSDLIKWVNDDISRGCQEINIQIEGRYDLFDVIRNAQYEAIYSMGYQILNHTF